MPKIIWWALEFWHRELRDQERDDTEEVELSVSRLYVIKAEGNSFSVNSAGFKTMHDSLPAAAKKAGADWELIQNIMYDKENKSQTVFVSVSSRGTMRVY